MLSVKILNTFKIFASFSGFNASSLLCHLQALNLCKYLVRKKAFKVNKLAFDYNDIEQFQ